MRLDFKYSCRQDWTRISVWTY